MIEGDLDLAQSSLPIMAMPVEQIIEDNENRKLSKNLKLIDSAIIIRNSEIRGSVNFADCLFREEFYIENSGFNGHVNFKYSNFRKNCSFKNALFNKAVQFNNAVFNIGAKFENASFGGAANFRSVQLQGEANFQNTQFIKIVSLESAKFYDGVLFNGSKFSGPVNFENTMFLSDALFISTMFEKEVSFEKAIFMKMCLFGYSQFLSISSFINVQFQGPAEFNNVKSKENANFTGAEFSKDAIFRESLFVKSFVHDDVMFLGRIDIDGADFGNIEARKYIESIITENKSSIDDSKNVGVENATESESSDTESEVHAPSINSDDKIALDPNPIDIAAGILADRSEADLLGFSDYADALTDFIRNKKPEEPLIIGIDAAWGMGKTKLMEMIKNNLNESSNRIVWFNAWKYDKEKSLWAALVLEILAQVHDKSNQLQRLELWTKLNYKKFDKNSLVCSLIKSSTLIGVSIVLGYLIFIALSLVSDSIASSSNKYLIELYTFVSILEQFRSISVLGFAVALFVFGRGFYSRFIGPFDLKIGKYVQEPNYKERVGFLAQFDKDFKYIVDLVTEKGKRPLVIFIDDLDRCTPPKPADIIEAINVLLDANHCVFIIGMDSQAVAASIEAKYKDLKECYYGSFDSSGVTLGQRFLEKIIQINFHIPRAVDYLMASFVDASLGGSLSEPKSELEGKTREKEVEDISALIEAEEKEGKPLEEVVEVIKSTMPNASLEAINEARMRRIAKILFENSGDVRQAINGAVPYLGSNPRKIKRFINLFRLMALIANRRGLLERKIIRLDSLAKWVVVTMRWPQMIETIASNHNFVSSLMIANIDGDRHLKYMHETSAKDTQDLIELMKGIREEELHYYLHLAETTVESHNR